MRKILLILLIIITGIIFLGYLFRGKPGSRFFMENDFRIRDTAAVYRIEIISENTIILTRQGNNWLINGDSPASSVAVNNFLFSFSRMVVKGVSNIPVNEEGKGTEVKIFEGKGKNLIRFFEIDGKSFMQKEAGMKLYAVEIQGFPKINPAEIVSDDPDHWRDRTLLNLPFSSIKEITVLHPSSPDKDFHIKVIDDKPLLFDGSGQNKLPESLIDNEKLNFYLSYFMNVFYDRSYNSEIRPGEKPMWIVRVEDTTGRKYELEVFPLRNGNGLDMFRALVKYNNQPGYKVTRYMVLDLILQEKEHFILGSQ